MCIAVPLLFQVKDTGCRMFNRPPDVEFMCLTPGHSPDVKDRHLVERHLYVPQRETVGVRLAGLNPLP